MHANLASPDSAGGKVRHDQGNVADTGDHRIGFVDWALSNRSAGMCVNIGDDSEILRLADFPEPAEGVPLNLDVSAQTVGIQIIEVFDINNAARIGVWR